MLLLGCIGDLGIVLQSQLESAFKSLKDTLAELGLPLTNLVKVNVWLKDINDLPTMENLFNNYFKKGNFQPG